MSENTSNELHEYEVVDPTTGLPMTYQLNEHDAKKYTTAKRVANSKVASAGKNPPNKGASPRNKSAAPVVGGQTKQDPPQVPANPDADLNSEEDNGDAEFEAEAKRLAAEEAEAATVTTAKTTPAKK